ncbi:MAG: ABC transporter substrate-binding protein [Flavobacteriales bacterium]|nr:ABC transporter substrate-binding protein [Flavobacteriales bacterium]MBK6755674.1 ABC transporter substrate-binding protein [Flavobacteriales bacterium]MBK7083787.1 ABC transporter substrate-binding protein [Flavobacteriales bacterium]MBK7754382.1 ABC transporter substrate-binding protein [Flavobacteriales bacterium]MBK9538366.1 ABC transporter substrate-binding protein [Flavobacteriales bacterium]
MNSIALRIAGVPEHFNLPWHLGLERRAFVRAGIDLKWRTVAEGTGAMCKLLRSGEIDLAILVTEGAVRDILNGNPACIIAPYVDSPLTWGVHVGAGSAITEPEQLRNVPYAISRPNSGSHLAAMAYALTHSWKVTEKDLVIVNDLPGAVERLQGPSPLAFLWEKYTTKPLVDSGALRRVDEYRSSWPSFVIVARESVLAEHAEPVKRLLKVIRDQSLGLMSKKTAPEIIAQRYNLKIEDARAWFSEVRWNTNGRLEDHALTAVAATLRQAGMLDGDLTKEVLCQKLLWPPQKS